MPNQILWTLEKKIPLFSFIPTYTALATYEDLTPYNFTNGLDFDGNLGGHPTGLGGMWINRMYLSFDTTSFSTCQSAQIFFTTGSYTQFDGDVLVYPSTIIGTPTVESVFNDFNNSIPLQVSTIRNNKDKIVTLNSTAITMINNNTFKVALISPDETILTSLINSYSIRLVCS